MSIVKIKSWNKCSIKEKVERWMNAERVLKGLPEHVRREHWDMRHWGIQTECGTVCCAAGHCGLDPWFNRRGFVLKPIELNILAKNRLGDEESLLPKTIGDLEAVLFQPMSPGQGGFENGVTVIEFFGASSERIFGNPKTRSVEDVIKEIHGKVMSFKTDIKRAETVRLFRIKDSKKEAARVLKESFKRIELDYKEELAKVYR